jgi:hypothetical protein
MTYTRLLISLGAVQDQERERENEKKIERSERMKERGKRRRAEQQTVAACVQLRMCDHKYRGAGVLSLKCVTQKIDKAFR